MGGIFGVVSKEDCVSNVFYGTDYQFHLGTRRGGLTLYDFKNGFDMRIYSIERDQFRSKFEEDIRTLKGNFGIGAISDYETQPLIIDSPLGQFALAGVGKISNLNDLENKSIFLEMSGGERNQAELAAKLISQGANFLEGIVHAQDSIRGSYSLVLLAKEGLYVARDKFGRTPLVIGENEKGFAVASETCAFPNLGFQIKQFVGPGEIVFLNPDGIQQLKKPNDKMQVCSFLWVYYGYPASNYEGINVGVVRERCGAALAKGDNVEVDIVAGIPDSGTAHAIGYLNQSHLDQRKIRFAMPFVKYTPTWPRSFMPQYQEMRDLVARMKLIPILEFIKGERILFCEDSIVRGTQLQDLTKRVFNRGAREVHMRPACPPLTYTCNYLNFSRSKSEKVLASRIAMRELGIEDPSPEQLKSFSNPDSQEFAQMVERIRIRLNLTSLKYQKLDDLVKAMGLPKENLCTYCWDGVDISN